MKKSGRKLKTVWLWLKVAYNKNMSTPRIYRIVGTYTPRRPSFLVQANRIVETNGCIEEMEGPYRMTSTNGKSTKNDPDLCQKHIKGLFTYREYSFKLLKRKSIWLWPELDYNTPWT